MAFGRKVNDRIMPRKVFGHRVLIADVGVNESAPTIVEHIFDVREIAGVGELVEHGDLVVGVGQHPAHIVRADEPSGTGDKEFHGLTDQVRSGQYGRRPTGRSARMGLSRSRCDSTGLSTPQ